MIYTFRLDRPAIAIISLALGARPHSEVAGLIAHLQQQIDAQEETVRKQADGTADAPFPARRERDALG